jgi:glycosyltransferase involved in cell wall biosynthesis
MRITIANCTSRQAGGVESYLGMIIPALARRGHQLSFLCETDAPEARARIPMVQDLASWRVDQMGPQQALNELRDWRPDVIYVQKFFDPEIEAAVQRVASSVFFVHDYTSICVSGMKSFKRPVAQPCHCKSGPACLLRYFPRGCGGDNPWTMIKLFRLQARRLELLRRYDALITHTEHMRDSLAQHGLNARKVQSFPCFEKDAQPDEAVQIGQDEEGGSSRPWRLVFSGRMERLKGAEVFLESLPKVVSGLNRSVHVTLAGDGGEREKLETIAAELNERCAGLTIEFTGWLNRDQIQSRLATCDLLVAPSLWPEPFGMVGPEAGLHGAPAAAFSVGGIPEWLVEGVNGALAPADPPTAAGLADAILRCLSDPAKYARLREGAFEMARRFNLEDHLESLLSILTGVAADRREHREKRPPWPL